MICSEEQEQRLAVANEEEERSSEGGREFEGGRKRDRGQSRPDEEFLSANHKTHRFGQNACVHVIYLQRIIRCK